MTANEFLKKMRSPEYKERCRREQAEKERREDAYYDALGKEIDEHPIGRRGVRGC